MKLQTLFLMAMIACLTTTTTAQDKNEPADLVRNRKIFMSKVDQAKREYNEKVRRITRQYLSVLEKTKLRYTKAGKLQAALAVKAEIDKLKPVVEKPEKAPGNEDTIVKSGAQTGVRVSKVVIHQTNGRHNDTGVESGVLRCFSGKREVFTDKFRLSWKPDTDSKVEIPLRAIGAITSIRVECSTTLRYAGLTEIEVLDKRGENIAPKASLKASSTLVRHNHRLRNLTDGKTRSNTGVDWMARPRDTNPWILMKWD